MLWVVIGHSPLAMDESIPVYVELLYKFAYSFHMPLFIMISGYLFYMTRVRPVSNGGGQLWSYNHILKDKLIRLGIPFLVFTVIAMVVKSMFPGDMARQSSISISELVRAILYPGDGPLGELWFVAVIMWGFVFTPIWRVCLKSSWGMIGMFLFLLICYYRQSLGWYHDIHFLCIENAMDSLLFFYIGIILSKFCIADKTNTKESNAWFMMTVGAIAYIFIDISLIRVFSAIVFSCGLAFLLDRHLPQTFSSFRNYTYQIFLIGIFAQIAVKMVYKRVDMQYFFGYALCVLLGLYVPVIVSKFAEYLNWRTFLLCIGLKEKKKR